MTQKRTRSGTARGRQSQQAGRKTGLIVVAGIFAVALIAFIVATVSAGDGGSGTEQVGEVSISGDALPLLPSQGADPAVGMTMPELRGTDFDGTSVAITNDGRAKVVLFLTHW